LVAGNALDTTLPYAQANYFTDNGPFSSRNADIMNYAIDGVRVKYINTQNSLTVAGKHTTSVFY
jgi:hypothetical protein